MGDRADDLTGVPLLVSVLPSDLARTRGGGERYAFELQRALARRLPDWTVLGLVAASERPGELVPEGWQVAGGARSGSLPSGDALPVREVFEAVPVDADLVICHQWRTRNTAALRLRHAVRRRGTLVGIDHGGGSVAGYRLDRLPLPSADVGGHVSEFEAALSPVKATRHRVLRGGVDPGLFRPPDKERCEHDFLMVGRFLRHKGQALFLDSLPATARALLIGPRDSDDPGYRDDVAARAARSGVEVRFDASDAELAAAYQRSHYTVQVPVQTVRRQDATPLELLGLTMLEAMACGSVPICPTTGSSAEFVRDGSTGLGYRAGSRDDLARVLSGALAPGARREELRRGAVEEASRWTWASAADTLLAAL